MAETTADWHDRQAQHLAEQAIALKERSDWHTRQAEALRECARMDEAMIPHEHEQGHREPDGMIHEPPYVE